MSTSYWCLTCEEKTNGLRRDQIEYTEAEMTAHLLGKHGVYIKGATVVPEGHVHASYNDGSGQTVDILVIGGVRVHKETCTKARHKGAI